MKWSKLTPMSGTPKLKAGVRSPKKRTKVNKLPIITMVHIKNNNNKKKSRKKQRKTKT